MTGSLKPSLQLVAAQFPVPPLNSCSADEILEAAKWCVGKRLAVELEAGPNVVVEIAAQPALKVLILHAVNYDVRNALASVPVSMGVPENAESRAVRFIDPESGADEEVPFKKDGDRVSFVLPHLRIYSIALVELG